MPFLTDTQKRCFDGVFATLQLAFPGDVRQDAAAAKCFVRRGGSMAEVRVEPWRSDLCRIAVRAVVLGGVQVSSSLLAFLLEQNERMDLGAFAMGERDEVVFQHAFVARAIEPAVVTASVHAVLGTAATFETRIRAKWGGLPAAHRDTAKRAVVSSKPPARQVANVDASFGHEQTATNLVLPHEGTATDLNAPHEQTEQALAPLKK